MSAVLRLQHVSTPSRASATTTSSSRRPPGGVAAPSGRRHQDARRGTTCARRTSGSCVQTRRSPNAAAAAPVMAVAGTGSEGNARWSEPRVLERSQSSRVASVRRRRPRSRAARPPAPPSAAAARRRAAAARPDQAGGPQLGGRRAREARVRFERARAPSGSRCDAGAACRGGPTTGSSAASAPASTAGSGPASSRASDRVITPLRPGRRCQPPASVRCVREVVLRSGGDGGRAAAAAARRRSRARAAPRPCTGPRRSRASKGSGGEWSVGRVQEVADERDVHPVEARDQGRTSSRALPVTLK